MFLVKHFPHQLLIKVGLTGDNIAQVSLFDCGNGYPREFFSIGYTLLEKTNLYTGWINQRSLKAQAEAARMLSEAFDIFEDDFTKDELIKIGYKETNSIKE